MLLSRYEEGMLEGGRIGRCSTRYTVVHMLHSWRVRDPKGRRSCECCVRSLVCRGQRDQFGMLRLTCRGEPAVALRFMLAPDIELLSLRLIFGHRIRVRNKTSVRLHSESALKLCGAVNVSAVYKETHAACCIRTIELHSLVQHREAIKLNAA
jgi:hypothetical protein